MHDITGTQTHAFQNQSLKVKLTSTQSPGL